MKKIKIRKNPARKISVVEKKLDHACTSGLYGFLFEKGVSHEIAEEAQEWLTNKYYDNFNEIENLTRQLDEISSDVVCWFAEEVERVKSRVHIDMRKY